VCSQFGRIGLVLPTGIATDSFNQYFFRNLSETKSIASLYGFENEEKLFPNVHNEFKFCLLTLCGAGASAEESDFLFFARRLSHLRDGHRHFSLSADDIALLNPNTRTCPVFRAKRDAEISKAVYQRIPVLELEGPETRDNPWGVSFMLMFMMNTASHLFRTQEQLKDEGWVLQGNAFRRGDSVYLPLYEGKMIGQFDHRFGTYEGQTQAQANKGLLPQVTERDHADPSRVVLPKYWVPEAELPAKARCNRSAYLGFRDITNAVVTRTAVFALLPPVAFGHTLPLVLRDTADPAALALLAACMNSFVFDFITRQKLGGTHLSFFVLRQLPVLPPTAFAQRCPWDMGLTLGEWVWERAFELTYTSNDLEPYARSCGFAGPPFRWDPERRLFLRCQLDAAFFRLYGLSRDEVEHVMESFWVVRNRDEAAHGEYRTKLAVLNEYDALA
jgi:hypothetical protein